MMILLAHSLAGVGRDAETRRGRTSTHSRTLMPAAPGRTRAIRPLYMVSVLLMLTLSGTSLPGLRGDEKAKHEGSFVSSDSHSRAIVKQMYADERQITIRQANLFHYRFVDQCMDRLPKGLRVEYAGVLRTENADAGQRVVGQIGDPLRWSVLKDVGIFSFWISTKRTKQTVSKCSIEGLELFVNVDFVDENRSLDERLPELGGRSVRQVLSKIDVPLAKPHYPPPRDDEAARK